MTTEEMIAKINQLDERVKILEDRGTANPRVDNESLILAFLKENRMWHMAKSVAMNIGINPSTCSSAMIRMTDKGMIECNNDGGNRNLVYRAKEEEL